MKRLKGELFLCTTFIKPTTARETIWISGFLDKMQSAHRYGVVFIRAGAGYGKSTMLSKYFTESDQAYCWMTLAEEDAELPVFLKNLLLSVQGDHPEVVEEAQRVLARSEDPSTSWKYVLNALINGLHRLTDQQQELYLVLEDYHLIQGAPENDQAVAYLLHHIPPGIHVVLTSRRPFAFLPVSEWKLKGRYQRCLALCDRILEKDDCWENAYRLQILCQTSLGDRARAVQAYRRCKESLARNLGIRPAQETTATLKNAIRNL